MTTTAALLTKEEAAALLNTSTRTIDRWRQLYDLGEVRLTPTAAPRFKRSVIEAAIASGKFERRKKK